MAKKAAKKKTGKRTRSVAKKPVRRAGGRDTPETPPALVLPEPRTFERIMGQDRALGALRSAMQSDRVHHAWIFHGPEGVGKFTTALSWAAMLLEPDLGTDLGGNPLVDPHSETQRLIRAGTHPDLFVIRKELARYEDEKRIRDAKLASIPLEVVRHHLIEPARLAPVRKTGSVASRVFIVDEAEMLDRSPTNAPVQNAILKTLEEPTPGTVIILVTSSEDRLLPTIRSRCQRVAFGALDDEAMRAWARGSGLGPGPEEHGWLLAHAGGAPGRYAWAQEEGVYAWSREVLPMLECAMRAQHPVSLGTRMSELVDAWAKDWVKRGEKIGEHRSKEAANRLGAARMLAMVAEHARPMLRDATTAPRAAHTIELVERAKREMDSNVQIRFVMDHLVSGISGPAPVC